MIESLRTRSLSIAIVLAALVLATLACQAPSTADLLAAPGDVLYRDDFTDPSSGWSRGATDGGSTDYAGGGYRITVTAPGYNYWATPGLSFGNVRVEADALKFGGPEINRIGLICRYRDAANFYFFIISSDGYYGIGKVKDGQTQLLGASQMQPAAAVHPGTVDNRLRADCNGSTLAFYVNDQPVGLAVDHDLAGGDVGILAGAFDEAGVDVLFDNFTVYKP